MVPTSIRDANRYVARWHRHSAPVGGALFALACIDAGALEPCGVVIVGRPKARQLQRGATCEVVRLATDGTRNACSFLYARARRAAQALGYQRVVTYTLQIESGASLRGLGALEAADVRAQSWDRPGRRRIDHAMPAERIRWELIVEPDE